MRQVMCLSAVIASVAVTLHAAEPLPLSFAEFVAGVDSVENTALGAQSFWAQHRNRQVTWTARVAAVKRGRRGAEIYLLDAAHPAYRGYNIVLVTTHRSGAAVLKEGDSLRFQGTLYRYKARPGHPLVVTLTNGLLLDATTPAADPVAPSAAERFDVFAAALSSDHNTQLSARANWDKLRLLTVTWTAEVVEVKGGRSGATLYLADPSAPLYRGYNIVVDTYDRQAAMALKKGAMVRVVGQPARYTHRRGGPVVVTLRNGQISSH